MMIFTIILIKIDDDFDKCNTEYEGYANSNFKELFTCVWWFDFDCQSAEDFYALNEVNIITVLASALIVFCSVAANHDDMI